MPQDNRGRNVAIVGAGIAGLTAALRLAQRGYKVTVYEAKPFIGGNVGDHAFRGGYAEVYPHMFGNWYNNFWDLVETDLGLIREQDFAPRTGFKFLRAGQFPHCMHVTNVGSLQSALPNLLSGIAPIPDVFLWSYSMLDLLSQALHQNELLSRISVNGFMSSRPYATNRSAALHDAFLLAVWSLHSDAMSAASYKRFIEYSFPHPSPEFWVLKGTIHDKLMMPLQQALLRLGCEIEMGVSVTEVSIENGKVHRIYLQDTEYNEQDNTTRLKDSAPRQQPVDYVVLALPPAVLGKLIMAGKAPQRIVDQMPKLAELRRLRAEPIPSMDLYFKRKLPHIPQEYVSLLESSYDLSFVDFSQIWPEDPRTQGVTALNVSASDFYALPSEEPHEDAYTLIQELHRYLPVFEPGAYWGDPHSDIDWDRLHYQSNMANELFSNVVGSEQWRPETTYKQLPNLFFAGDFCKTTINIATVEAAVMSGLQAAQALWHREPLGQPIKIIQPEAYPTSAIMAMKLLMAPYVYGAKCWSIASDAMPQLARGKVPSDLSSNIRDMLLAPYACAADWWETMWSFSTSVWYKGRSPGRGSR